MEVSFLKMLWYVVTGIDSVAQDVIWEAGSFHFSDLTSLTWWFFIFVLFTSYLQDCRLATDPDSINYCSEQGKEKKKKEEESERSFPLIREEFPKSFPDFPLHLIDPN